MVIVNCRPLIWLAYVTECRGPWHMRVSKIVHFVETPCNYLKSQGTRRITNLEEHCSYNCSKLACNPNLKLEAWYLEKTPSTRSENTTVVCSPLGQQGKGQRDCSRLKEDMSQRAQDSRHGPTSNCHELSPHCRIRRIDPANNPAVRSSFCR